ncbi:MAG: hypothetical protein HZB13_10695, partial [Acidobacteria bacterium]|nr:hypothetical protein [Acidobacteriota bacterium]
KVFYDNIQREDVYYGALTQISGYRAINHNRNAGVNWEWRKTRWPQLLFEWQNTDITSQPNVAELPATRSGNNSSNLTIKDNRLGWDLSGYLRKYDSTSEFSYGAPGAFQSATFDQHNSQAEATAFRQLGSSGIVNLNAGNYVMRTSGAGFRFNQDLRFLQGSINSGAGRRVEAGLRGAYNSNIFGRPFSEMTALLSAVGVSNASPSQLAPAFLNYNMGNVNWGGDLRYRVVRGLSAYTSVSQGAALDPPNAAGVQVMDYVTTSAGAHFEHRYSWAQINADFHGTRGITSTPNQPNSRLSGYGYSGGLQSGDVDRLEFSASYNDNRQRSELSNLSAYASTSRWANFTIGRRVPLLGMTFRLGGGVNDSHIETHSASYLNKGYSVNANLSHARFQAGYSRLDGEGNTLPMLVAGLTGGPAAGALVPLLPRPLPYSRRRGTTFTGCATPFSRLQARFLYVYFDQQLDHKSMNAFKQIDAAVGYKFRRLTFELGYSSWDQSILGIPNYVRERLYVRVTRPFNLLSR